MVGYDFRLFMLIAYAPPVTYVHPPPRMKDGPDGIASITTLRYWHEGDRLDCRLTSVGFTLIYRFILPVQS